MHRNRRFPTFFFLRQQHVYILYPSDQGIRRNGYVNRRQEGRFTSEITDFYARNGDLAEKAT